MRAIAARLTVRHNGVLIHDDLELAESTGGGDDPEGPAPEKLTLGSLEPRRVPQDNVAFDPEETDVQFAVDTTLRPL